MAHDDQHFSIADLDNGQHEAYEVNRRNEAAMDIQSASLGDSRFRDGLEELINLYSAENGSDTPDHILANYLWECLQTFDKHVLARDAWYGIAPHPGWSPEGAGRAEQPLTD